MIVMRGPQTTLRIVRFLRPIQPVHRGASRLAQPCEDGSRVGNGARDHLAHRFVGRVGGHRLAAIGDESVKVKHSFLRLCAGLAVILSP